MSTRRKKRHRKGRITPILWLISLLLTVGGATTALTMFFKVGQIVVEGNDRCLSDELIATTEVQTGDNLILLNRYGIAQSICQAHPYVETVQIRRKLPDTLVLSITEETAVASVFGDGGWWLLSRSGKLLEQTEENTACAYFQIVGVEVTEPQTGQRLQLPEDSSLTIERLTEFLTALQEKNLLERVEQLDVSRRVWRMKLDGKFEVELSCSADFGYKLDCLKATVERLEPNEVGTIRMTMTDEREVRFIPRR